MASTADTLRGYLSGHDDKFPTQLAQRFPHIVTRLVELWETPDEARSYFKALLLTDRPNRQGFPPEVYFELFALSNLYDDLRPMEETNEEIWSHLETK
jgi:hypothetical protein